MKFDVQKAFDMLDWSFLLNVLAGFGFCATFCCWVRIILELARLSFAINDSLWVHCL